MLLNTVKFDYTYDSLEVISGGILKAMNLEAFTKSFKAIESSGVAMVQFDRYVLTDEQI
jgi:hypothetical protein